MITNTAAKLHALPDAERLITKYGCGPVHFSGTGLSLAPPFSSAERTHFGNCRGFLICTIQDTLTVDVDAEFFEQQFFSGVVTNVGTILVPSVTVRSGSKTVPPTAKATNSAHARARC